MQSIPFDKNKSFHKWLAPTGYDETVQIKRTEIIMMMVREYYISDRDLEFIDPYNQSEKYKNARDRYWSCITPEQRSVIHSDLKIAITEFLREISDTTHKETLMLTKRYIDEINSRPSDDITSFRDKMYSVYTKLDKSVQTGTLYINYRKDEKTAEDIIDTAILKILGEKATTYPNMTGAIIFVPQKETKKLDKGLTQFKNQIDITIISEEYMRFAPIQHQLQPYFKIMNVDEKKKFLHDGYSLSQHPKILRSDPVVKFMDLNRGSIFEFHRENKQSSENKQITENSFYARVLI